MRVLLEGTVDGNSIEMLIVRCSINTRPMSHLRFFHHILEHEIMFLTNQKLLSSVQ